MLIWYVVLDRSDRWRIWFGKIAERLRAIWQRAKVRARTGPDLNFRMSLIRRTDQATRVKERRGRARSLILTLLALSQISKLRTASLRYHSTLYSIESSEDRLLKR